MVGKLTEHHDRVALHNRDASETFRSESEQHNANRRRCDATFASLERVDNKRLRWLKHALGNLAHRQIARLSNKTTRTRDERQSIRDDERAPRWP